MLVFKIRIENVRVKIKRNKQQVDFYALLKKFKKKQKPDFVNFKMFFKSDGN